MFNAATMTTEKLTNLIIMREKYPQFNSPQDRAELAEAKAELSRRNIGQPERQHQTDFKYRLERYGY